jgi:hypothetical protein
MLHSCPFLIELPSPSITEAIDLYSYSAVHPYELMCFVWHGCFFAEPGYRCSESFCRTALAAGICAWRERISRQTLQVQSIAREADGAPTQLDSIQESLALVALRPKGRVDLEPSTRRQQFLSALDAACSTKEALSVSLNAYWNC